MATIKHLRIAKGVEVKIDYTYNCTWLELSKGIGSASILLSQEDKVSKLTVGRVENCVVHIETINKQAWLTHADFIECDEETIINLNPRVKESHNAT